MKKVKTLLVTAVAALSLSSCTFQDVANYAKNAGGQVGSFFTSLLEKVGLKKKEERKEEPCQHEDKNHDGTCDICGEAGLEVVHVDENHDHNCDVCGAVLSQHADADNDLNCDVCGEELAVTSIELDTSAAQLAFSKDEAFSSEGLKVVATSEVGSKKELEFTPTAPDMTTTGEKEVVVNFEFRGEQRSLSYNISVEYWSEADLELFAEASYTEYAPLPYLPGVHMRTVVDDQNNDWSIVADPESGALYLDYYEMLKGFKKTATIDGETVYFELNEISAPGASVYGLDETVVFSMVPYWKYSDTMLIRQFSQSEYIVLGLDHATGGIVLKSRLIEASLEESLYFTDYLMDGDHGYYAQAFKTTGEDVFARLFSEISGDLFVFPEMGDKDVVYPYNFKYLKPFDFSLDEYTINWKFECGGSPTEEKFNDFVNALKAKGYEEKDLEGGGKSYVIDDELAGYIEYIPVYDTTTYTKPYIIFDFNYKAPKEFTYLLDLDVVDLMKSLSISEYEVDRSNYELSSALDAWVEIAAPDVGETGKTAEMLLCTSLAQALVSLGFECTAAPAASGEGLVIASFTDYSTINVKLGVFAPDEGKDYCDVCFQVSRFYNFSVDDVFKAIFDTYTKKENEDGSFSVVEDRGTYTGDPVTNDIISILSSIYGGSDILDIGNVDYLKQSGSTYNIWGNDDGGYLFVGVTKDGRLRFIIDVTPSDGKYVLTVTVVEMSEQEKAIRAIMDYFSYVVFDVTYEENAEGGFEFDNWVDLYSNKDTFASSFVALMTAEGFTQDEGSPKDDVYSFSNDTLAVTATFTNDSDYLNLKLVVSKKAAPVAQPMTPAEVAALFATALKTEVQGPQNGTYGVVTAYAASEEVTIAAVEALGVSLIPEEFVKMEDWTEDTQSPGTYYCMYMNDAYTVIELSVYASQVPSDPTDENSALVDVIVLQAVTYTYSA